MRQLKIVFKHVFQTYLPLVNQTALPKITPLVDSLLLCWAIMIKQIIFSKLLSVYTFWVMNGLLYSCNKIKQLHASVLTISTCTGHCFLLGEFAKTPLGYFQKVNIYIPMTPTRVGSLSLPKEALGKVEMFSFSCLMSRRWAILKKVSHHSKCVAPIV